MISEKARGYKNLIGVCLSFIFVYGLFSGIIYLQSSINSDDGLGLTSAAVAFSAAALCLMFVPTLYSRFGSKYSLIIGYFFFILYAISNYYPSWFTLLLGSLFAGIGLSIIFVNAQTHCSDTAHRYASSLGESSSNAVALYLGVFGTSIKLATLLGSVTSSSILFNLDYSRYSSNATEEDSNLTCANTEAAYVAQDVLYYVLITVFLAFGIIGIIVGGTLMDNFGTEAKFVSLSKWLVEYFVHTLFRVLKLGVNWRMFLLFPFFVINGISLGFVAGTFPKVFVSDCLGVQWIGYVVASYSISGAVAGVTFGRLYRYVPEFVLIYFAVVVGGGLTLFLIVWNREPNYFAVFGFAIGWGLCDGVWQSLVAGIVGNLFEKEKNAAYTIFELGVSLGFVTTFVSGLVFTTAVHLWIIFALIAYGCLSYTVLVTITKCCLRNGRSSKDHDDVKMDMQNDVNH